MAYNYQQCQRIAREWVRNNGSFSAILAVLKASNGGFASISDSTLRRMAKRPAFKSICSEQAQILWEGRVRSYLNYDGRKK